jgi:hypothetical protein
MAKVNMKGVSNMCEWTNEKNIKRCALIDKEVDGTITGKEQIILDWLQAEMLAHRKKTAPLPIGKLKRFLNSLKLRVKA